MRKSVTLKISDPSDRCVLGAHTLDKLPGIISVNIKKESKYTVFFITYESERIKFDTIQDYFIYAGFDVAGYIIHEHSHTHGTITHSHPHIHPIGETIGEATHDHKHD